MDGSLLRNAAVTLVEVLLGLALGVSVATVLGYLLARSLHLERLLSPYIVASQSIPIVAIAPLLVIWFGPGLSSKVLICALIVFFPVLVNTVVGVRSVPEDLRDLMRSLQATRWQTLKSLEAPAALPVFLGRLAYRGYIIGYRCSGGRVCRCKERAWFSGQCRTRCLRYRPRFRRCFHPHRYGSYPIWVGGFDRKASLEMATAT